MARKIVPPQTKLPLLPTDIPDVYRNTITGQMCDARGVAYDIEELKAAEEQRFMETMGSVPTTPAEYLRAIAMDPRRTLGERLDAAKSAAPYFDMKMPIRTENTNKNEGVQFDMAKMAAMKKNDRELLLKLLKQLGVEL